MRFDLRRQQFEHPLDGSFADGQLDDPVRIDPPIQKNAHARVVRQTRHSLASVPLWPRHADASVELLAKRRPSFPAWRLLSSSDRRAARRQTACAARRQNDSASTNRAALPRVSRWEWLRRACLISILARSWKVCPLCHSCRYRAVRQRKSSARPRPDDCCIAGLQLDSRLLARPHPILARRSGACRE